MSAPSESLVDSAADLESELQARREQEHPALLNQKIDAAAQGVGKVVTGMGRAIERAPVLKYGLVAMDVASGPAMYLVREGLAATPVGSWIEAEQERAVGAVSNRFEERPGYSRADAGNAAVGTISVGGMTFFGAAGLLKRLPMIERLLAKLPRAKFSDDRNVQMAGTGSLPAANKLGEAHNAASFAKYKEMLLVSEKASPLVDSITATGRLPGNFVTKQQAINAGWRPGRALNNYVPGGADRRGRFP